MGSIEEVGFRKPALHEQEKERGPLQKAAATTYDMIGDENEARATSKRADYPSTDSG